MAGHLGPPGKRKCPVSSIRYVSEPRPWAKARRGPPGRAAPLPRGATPPWPRGGAPCGRGGTGLRRCCAHLNWHWPVLRSRALPQARPASLRCNVFMRQDTSSNPFSRIPEPGDRGRSRRNSKRSNRPAWVGSGSRSGDNPSTRRRRSSAWSPPGNGRIPGR